MMGEDYLGRARPSWFVLVDVGTLTQFVFCALFLLGLKSVDAAVQLTPGQFGLVCFAVLIFIMFRTWRQTGGGNHPVFLFLLFLGLFQFGRMFSWLIFGNWAIEEFNLTVPKPFKVEDSALKASMFLVPLSAAFVYLGFFWSHSHKQLTFARNDSMRTFFGWLYFITIPFVIYKSGSYLRYALENGGYVATYLGEGEHLQQVGLIMRALALLNTMAFLPYIVVEDRVRLLRFAIASYLVIMVLELLVGFRGKFFTNLMFLWMVYNIKRGTSFKPLTALVGAVLLMAAAIGAEIFRESKSSLDINLVEYFLVTQGVSFYVTVSSVLYYDIFHPHIWAYLANQFVSPYVHLSTFGENQLLTLDLTSFLNPNVVSYALGTGETYLAHLYLMYGVPTVILGSFLIGLFCAWLNTAKSVYWRMMALSVFLWIPYLPRSGLLEPLASGTKYLIVGSGAFLLFGAYKLLILGPAASGRLRGG